ncbi:hypothetical protein NM688_g5091 [Phlebia brevispora]|uniref:Uncharacterized protein n=1 Tax=Phlebia brevispora TaxID=194682 RepID=A0ACC1T164_9APHY|nr:hypothetical protein NM688_g5091 [Phlebia brevispora]
MSGPKNNLDDILRKRGEFMKASSPTVGDISAPASKAKFRAVEIAAPSTPVRSLTLPATGALALLYRVALAQTDHLGSRDAWVVIGSIVYLCLHSTTDHTSLSSRLVRRTPASESNPRNASPVPVSSNESSPASCSSIPSKRTSPPTASIPPYKRPKASSHKENLYQQTFKGNTREHPVHVSEPATSISRHLLGTPVRLSVSQQMTAPSTPRGGHSGSEPQIKVHRTLEVDYSDLLNMTAEDLEKVIKDVRDVQVQWLHSLMPLPDITRNLLVQIDSALQDVVSCAGELIKVRRAKPLRIVEDPAISLYPSTVLLSNNPEPLPALHIDRLAVPSSSYDLHAAEDADMDMNLPNSDDHLWESMEDMTQDELDFDPLQEPELSEAPSLLPPVPMATPLSSQDTASTNPPASSSANRTSTPSTSTSSYYTPDASPAVPDPTLLNTPFYPDVIRLLHSTFKLPSFRPNQLEVISTCMEDKDVFVLMPTGGGKSLCYQLPAVLKNQQHNTVTFIISPLKSLMADQVASLQARGISVVLINSDLTEGKKREAFARLDRPGQRPCMAYVTPELLQKSQYIQHIMKRLADSKGIAGFVADEAHVISVWGRGFRESYAELFWLREEFPDVPFMALTATANRQTIQDVIHKLRLRDCKIFRSSFNRPNLIYVVKPKGGRGGKALEDLVQWIGERHRDETGIVYCSSRNKCEQTARDLQKQGLSAEYYHAELSPDEKSRVQGEWQEGRIKIIVATIAFGMGIDKPDVRFVVHLDMPTSLSGYYQETGRAGRDGLPADCRLYYSYQDAKYPMERARTEAKTAETGEAEVNDIRRVVEFSTNDVDCRRMLMLTFLDEKFDAANCHGTCDNCMNPAPVVSEDLTQAAANMIQLVRELDGDATRVQLIEVYIDKLGRGSQKFADSLQRGCGKEVPRDLAERLFDYLVNEDLIAFVNKQNGSGWSTSYATLVHDKARAFLDNHTEVILRYRPQPPKRARGKKGKERTESQDTDANQAGPSRQRRPPPKAVVETPSDPIEDFDAISESFWREDDNYDIAVVDTTKIVETNKITSVARAPHKAKSAPVPDSDSEVEVVEIKTARREDDWATHFHALLSHRDKLEAEEGLSLRDIFDDDVLQVISCVLPSDIQEFKHHLRAYGLDMDSPNIKLVPSFLQVIVPFRTARSVQTPVSPNKQKDKPLSMSQLHRQYDYQGASSSKPNSRA